MIFKPMTSKIVLLAQNYPLVTFTYLHKLQNMNVIERSLEGNIFGIKSRHLCRLAWVSNDNVHTFLDTLVGFKLRNLGTERANI